MWVSHKHADHQCGLPRLLAEIRRLHGASVPENNKVTVVAPQEIVSYTFFVGCLSGHDDLIDCLTCSDMNDINNSSMQRLRGQTAGAIQSVYSTRVEHCHDAYAVKLVLLGKYVVDASIVLIDSQPVFCSMITCALPAFRDYVSRVQGYRVLRRLSAELETAQDWRTLRLAHPRSDV